MKVLDAYEYFLGKQNNKLKMNYEQLQVCGLDTGFSSMLKDGKDFHQITGEIAISFMNFHGGQLTNMLFVQGQPIVLDYDDEITGYYSDYIEIRYIIRGHLEVEIEGKMAGFNEKDICFINSLAYHKESIEQSNCLLLNVSIEKKYFTEAFINNVTLTPLKRFLRKNILRYSDKQHYLKFSPDSDTQAEILQGYLYHIIIEAVQRKSGYLDICKGFVTRLMCDLSEGYRFDFNKKETEQYSQTLFDSVSEFIKSNLQTIDKEALVKEFHYQPNYYNLLIKKHTGKTYSDYLVYLRMERAKYYLTTTDIGVDEIVWMVGYSNKGFFYKKFTEYTGITPSKYRKQ